MDVAAWLRGLGLERYVPAFRDNDIDAEVLPKLTAEDLISIGVTSVGHRRKLLDAIAGLGMAVPTAVVTAPAPGAPAQVDAERRQLTVMFCDLVGSTALSTRHDPEDLRELIGDYHRAVAETVGRFDGFVAKYMGDGVLIYFGYPQAHEDDAERAVRAGLAVIEAVGRLPAREDLRVRIGIATGLAVVGDLIGEGAAQERGVVGETPNLAARLQALAAPNTLVIAEATRRQIGALFESGGSRAAAACRLCRAAAAWRVLARAAMLSRFEALRSGETPLVGRDEELELLLRPLGAGEDRRRPGGADLRRAGHRQVAADGGAFRAASKASRIPGCAISARRTTRTARSIPFIGQLERAAGFARDDAASRRSSTSWRRCSPAADDRRASAAAGRAACRCRDGRFRALDLSPQRKKESTFEALLRQLEAAWPERQPVLMIFEDLHWIDPTSRELLDLAVARVERLPMLLIATFRPEFQPPWTGQPHVTTLSLSRLGRARRRRRWSRGSSATPPSCRAR